MGALQTSHQTLADELLASQASLWEDIQAERRAAPPPPHCAFANLGTRVCPFHYFSFYSAPSRPEGWDESSQVLSSPPLTPVRWLLCAGLPTEPSSRCWHTFHTVMQSERTSTNCLVKFSPGVPLSVQTSGSLHAL